MIGDYYIWIYELEYEVNQNFIVKVINDEEQIVISSNDPKNPVGEIMNFISLDTGYPLMKCNDLIRLKALAGIEDL